MAQTVFINITLDANVSKKLDRANDIHTKGLGAAASGDLTVSYDGTKITSLSVFRSAIRAAIEQAAGSMKP